MPLDSSLDVQNFLRFNKKNFEQFALRCPTMSSYRQSQPPLMLSVLGKHSKDQSDLPAPTSLLAAVFSAFLGQRLCSFEQFQNFGLLEKAAILLKNF